MHFIKSTDVIVFTQPSSAFKEFIEQRIRWTSKSKAYRDAAIISTAVVVTLINLLVLFNLVASVFKKDFLLIYFFIFAIKTAADLSIIFSVSKFFGKQNLLTYFIPLQIIYPFYIVFAAFMGLVGKFEWKNRSFR